MDQTHIFSRLSVLFPHSKIELHYTTPFQLLIAVIMSAQATDRQVNKVTHTLFETIKQPADVIAMGADTYNTAISSIGLHNTKTRNIYATAKILTRLKNE
jgi:endonuclease-3